MQPHSQAQSPAAANTPPEPTPRIGSADLLRGHRTVEIEHGQQRYTLRVTKDDKLILTK